MKKATFSLGSIIIALALTCMACNAPSETLAVSEKPDMEVIKAEIQAIENLWAAADNKGDVAAILAHMADDAITMPENKPAVVGKAAIQKDYEDGIAKRPAGNTVAYETVDVFGSDSQVTEVGRSTTKDSTGAITRTGKYVAIWEKRDGKYMLLRDIGNGDTKAE